jgi:hypothetical protein
MAVLAGSIETSRKSLYSIQSLMTIKRIREKRLSVATVTSSPSSRKIPAANLFQV